MRKLENKLKRRFSVFYECNLLRSCPIAQVPRLAPLCFLDVLQFWGGTLIYQSPFESTQVYLTRSKDDWSPLLSVQLTRNLIFVFSSDTLKRKCPSERVFEIEVLETLGTVPPSHCLHDKLLCVTHPDKKHVSQSWRDSNCCEEKTKFPFMVNACYNKPRIARHVYLRFLPGTVTPSNVPLVLCNLRRNENYETCYKIKKKDLN